MSRSLCLFSTSTGLIPEGEDVSKGSVKYFIVHLSRGEEQTKTGDPSTTGPPGDSSGVQSMGSDGWTA